VRNTISLYFFRCTFFLFFLPSFLPAETVGKQQNPEMVNAFAVSLKFCRIPEIYTWHVWQTLFEICYCQVPSHASSFYSKQIKIRFPTTDRECTIIRVIGERGRFTFGDFPGVVSFSLMMEVGRSGREREGELELPFPCRWKNMT
jgi:hypothetical protein